MARAFWILLSNWMRTRRGGLESASAAGGAHPDTPAACCPAWCYGRSESSQGLTVPLGEQEQGEELSHQQLCNQQHFSRRSSASQRKGVAVGAAESPPSPPLSP